MVRVSGFYPVGSRFESEGVHHHLWACGRVADPVRLLIERAKAPSQVRILPRLPNCDISAGFYSENRLTEKGNSVERLC